MKGRRVRPRVLVVNKFLHHVGGVETYIKWLSTKLYADGFDVAFFGMPPPPGGAEMALNGPTFHAPYRDYHGSAATKVLSAADSVYSLGAAKAFRKVVTAFDPHLVHFQSTCYQLTSSVVRQAAKARLPSLTTAHEYFLVCSNQRLWHDSRATPCVRCLGQDIPTRARNILETRCVKGSLGASTIAALELPISYRTWSSSPGLVHAPSRYMRDLLSAPTSPVASRVRYLDLSWGDEVAVGGPRRVPRVTYLGRLSREKGVGVLLSAWPAVTMQIPDARLEIYGSGDQEADLIARAGGMRGITFHGRYDPAQLPEILSRTTLTVHPSEWAENSPFTVRESLQAGVPVVVSDVGGMPEMVSAATGTVVPPSDEGRLAAAIVAELKRGRAGSDGLRDAVRVRALSDADHVAGLKALYSEASKAVGRPDVFA